MYFFFLSIIWEPNTTLKLGMIQFYFLQLTKRINLRLYIATNKIDLRLYTTNLPTTLPLEVFSKTLKEMLNVLRTLLGGI